LRAWRFADIAACCFGAAQVAAMTVEVETTPAGELFPALELSQSERQGVDAGQGNGLLRIRLGDVRMPHDVRLTVSTEACVMPA
jgi:hypothetical protein